MAGPFTMTSARRSRIIRRSPSADDWSSAAAPVPRRARVEHIRRGEVNMSRALVVPRLLPEMWESSGTSFGLPEDEGGEDNHPTNNPWDPDASSEWAPNRQRTSDKVVLVADDDFDTREMLAAALELWGYRVLLADDGVDALAETRASAPDLILLDLLMPELDGWGVLASLRLDPRTRNIPVIVISAVSRRGLAEEILAAGATAFVEKPFDIDVLEMIVQRFLDRD